MQEKPFIYQPLHPIFSVDNVCITMFHALSILPFLSTKYIFVVDYFAGNDDLIIPKKTIVGNDDLIVPNESFFRMMGSSFPKRVFL